MNAMLNINIRVASAQANAALKGVTGQVNALNAAGARAGNGGLGTLNNGLAKVMNLQKFGKNLQWTGRQLEYNFTLPLVLAGAAATKWALDNERAATSIAKVYGELGDDTAKLDAELDALSKSFELMSSRYGVLQEEVIEIGAAWAQAGAAGVAVAKATQLTLEAMVLGQMDAIEATRGVIAVQSAYRLNTKQLREALAQLNIIENQTSIGFHDLIDVITRAGGTARTAGIDIRHLSAMAATLVPATGSAAQAGNALRTMISRLMAPTKEASELMAKMGIDVMEASWQAKNGVERVEAMALAFDDLTQSQKAVVSSSVASRWQINRFDILMEDIAKSLDKSTASQSAYNRALEATATQSQANAVYAKELATVLESNPKRFEILTRTIQNSMAVAILPLLPAIMGILSAIAKLTHWFSELSPETQKLAMAFLFLLAAIGPVVRYFGSFILLGTTVAELLIWMKKMTFGLSAAQGIAAAAAQGHNLTLVQQHGIIGALLVRIGQFSKFLLSIPWLVVSKAAYAMWYGIGAAGSLAAKTVGFAWRAVFAILSYLLPLSRTLLSGVGTLATSAASAVAQAVTSAVSYSVSVMQTVMGVATGIVGKGLAALRGLYIIFMSGVSVLWWGLVGVATQVGTAVNAAWMAASKVGTAVWVAFTGAVAAVWRTLPAIAAATGRAVAMAWRTAMLLSGLAVQAFTLMLMNLPTIVSGIAKAVGVAWGVIPQIFAAIGKLAALAFANPLVGLAIIAAAAALAVAYHFRDSIAEGVQAAVDSLGQLPQAVVEVFRSVISIIRQAALAVYEWLSYLNPFATHSPSLVDQVTKGVSTILDQYSRLNGVKSILAGALRAINNFKSATGGAVSGMQMAEFQEQKKEIVAVAPGAAGEVDALIASIMQMYGALELVNEQIRVQQSLVDAMAADIAAKMKPYNDALAANELAQKKLRLELLRMEEAGQSIDDIRNKLATLQGEIEGMRSEQIDLRQAGAGSDVLAFYDQQIAALESQRTTLEQSVAPIQAMQDKLEELQRAAEILQLERDIKFDPQLAALDAEEEKLRALKDAYSEINSTISDMEGLLRSAAQAAKQTADALEQSNAEQMFDAAAAGDFESPGGTSPPGLGREGGLAEIEAFNAEMERQLNEALDGMSVDMFKPFKDAWNSAWGWIQDNVAPVVEPVVGAIQGFFSGINIDFGGMFDSLGGGAAGDTVGVYFQYLKDIFAGFLDGAKAVWEFLVAVFGPVFEWLGGVVEHAVKAIGGELANWGDMVDPLVEAFGHIAEAAIWLFKYILLPLFKVSLGVILVLWKAVWPVLKNTLTPIFNAIIGVIRGALEIIRGVISFVLAIINGDWGAAWEAILTIVDGVWDTIYSVISGAIGFIIGIVRGLVETVVGFFQWLYDVLVGHSIIPDMVNAIIGWFEILWRGVKAIWDLLWTAIKWAWENIGKPIFTAIKWAIDNLLLPAFRLAQQVIPPIFTAIGTAIKWVWDNVISKVFTNIKDGIGLVGSVMKFVADNIIKPVWNGILNVVSTVWSGMKSILERGINFFIDVFNALAGAINAVSSALGLGFHIDPKGHISMNSGGASGRDAATNPMLAAGGQVPAGGPGFMTNGIAAIVGEGNPMYPEFVIPTDPRYRKNALALLERLGVEMFAAGGIPGGGVVSGAGNVVVGAADAARSFWNKIQDIRRMIQDSALPWMGKGATKMVDMAVDFLRDKIIGGVGAIRDAAWDIGAVINPVDDIRNAFMARGGTIPNLADGGIVYPRTGGTLVNVGEAGQAEAVVPLPHDFDKGDTFYNFYDSTFDFPNITDPDDAQKFLDNLETLAGTP